MASHLNVYSYAAGDLELHRNSFHTCNRKFMVNLISKALEPPSLTATEDFEKTTPNVSLISSHIKYNPFSKLVKIKRNSSLSGSLQYKLKTSETLLSVMGNYIPSVIFMGDNQRQTDWNTSKIGIIPMNLQG